MSGEGEAMRLNVVLAEDQGSDEMRAAALERPDLEISFESAPSTLDYKLPFPIVTLEVEGTVLRQYGSDAEHLYYSVLKEKAG